MTKNRSMKIAVLVLALALITACFVGTTFAKYQSTATGNATVQVAKWEFEGLDLEQKTIDVDLLATVNEEDGSAAETDVATSNDNSYVIIAPGTSGTFTVEFKNTSEVNAAYTLVLNETNLNGIPLEFTYEDADGNELTAEQLSAAEGIALDMGETATVVVNWVWDYDADDDGDTELGIDSADEAVQGTVTVTVDVWQVN